MKEYVIELDQDELDAIDIAAWYIGGYGSTSRIVFSNVSDIKTIFYEYTKISNERHIHVFSSSELTFEKKVL